MPELKRLIARFESVAAGAQSGGSGGVLRLPYDLTSFGGARWDPTTPTNPDIWYAQRWIYDSLMRQNADGSYSPGLAKSATTPDGCPRRGVT